MAGKPKNESGILNAVRETASDFHRLGFIDKDRMRQYDDLLLANQNMELQSLRNDAELQAALQEIESLWNAKEATPEESRLEALAILVERYEDEHLSEGFPGLGTK